MATYNLVLNIFYQLSQRWKRIINRIEDLKIKSFNEKEAYHWCYRMHGRDDKWYTIAAQDALHMPQYAVLSIWKLHHTSSFYF
jgi:hypothetical protein